MTDHVGVVTIATTQRPAIHRPAPRSGRLASTPSWRCRRRTLAGRAAILTRYLRDVVGGAAPAVDVDRVAAVTTRHDGVPTCAS